jgi:hypothetical protein
MFPEQFAEQWIERCTWPGQTVLDPFSGRGTTPFQAVLMNRNAIGNDVNPVAFVLTGAKVDSPTQRSVEHRLWELEQSYRPEGSEAERLALPSFFKRAFHHTTLRQILYLRRNLNWKTSRVDRFIAALSLGALHGEMTGAASYFSNQMPRTISTKPAYSLRFWRERRLWPKQREVFSILRRKAAFRFESPRPSIRGKAYLSDVRMLRLVVSKAESSVDCVITSPPYLDVTNFEEDQWLRLWFLGGVAEPKCEVYSRDNRHKNPSRYWSFLCEAWQALRPLLAQRSTFICRIGGRNVDPNVIKETLSSSMQFLASRWKLQDYTVSTLVRRQTDAFRPGSVGCRFEVDFCFDLYQ